MVLSAFSEFIIQKLSEQISIYHLCNSSEINQYTSGSAKFGREGRMGR